MMLLAVLIAALFATASAVWNGVNLQPSYYNNGNVTFGWDLMKKHKEIRSVRIEIEPDKVSQAWNWIHEANSHGFDVVATYHKYTVLGSDNTKDLNDAAEWWKKNFKYLSGAGYFTINLMNEWGSHDQTADSYSKAYNNAIDKVREVYKDYIIIDIPGWGQETRIATNAAKHIKDNKVWLSAHVYPNGWNQAAGRYLQGSDFDELAGSGKSCLIGEYGTKGDGPVDVISVVNHAKKAGCFAVFAWAWNGDGGSMNMAKPAWTNNPSSQSYSESNYFSEVIGPL